MRRAIGGFDFARARRCACLVLVCLLLFPMGCLAQSPDKRIDSLIKATAWDDLVVIGKPAIEPLIAELRKHEKSTAPYFTMEEFAYAMAVAMVLGRMGDGAVVPLIKALETGKDYLTRSGAAMALGQIGDPRANKALQKAQRDPEPGVAFAAAGALQQINSRPKPPTKGR